jgi:hypothetical protein
LRTSSGAVIFVLESRESMERRGGKARGRIDATAAAFGAPAQLPKTAAAVLADLSGPTPVIRSATGTWLDRAETAAIRHAGHDGAAVTSLQGHVAELFSATPLVGIAAALLAARLPSMLAPLPGEQPASGEEPVSDLTSLCTDASGVASGVRIHVF